MGAFTAQVGKTCVGWRSWRSFCRGRQAWGVGWHVSRKARGEEAGACLLLAKEGWRGGTSHADSGGQEYDTGDVWVVTQVAKVKLSFLSWSPSRRVGGYQEHSVLHGSSGLASG